jgi:peptide/nickel transport system permease protein
VSLLAADSVSLDFAARSRSRRAAIGRALRGSPVLFLILLFVATLGLAAVSASSVSPFDPLEFHRQDRLLGPSGTYLLGTDQTGRDQLSRLIYGARVSLYVGVGAAVLSVLLGTALGLVSGYWGGTTETIIQRAGDAVMALPAIVVALIVIGLTGSSPNTVLLTLALIAAPGASRLARAATVQVAGLQYIAAAESLGASTPRLLARHILPNIVGPLVVYASSLVGTMILAESALGFLGLSVPPPTPTWGNMLSSDAQGFFQVAPWLMLAPGLAITVTVLAFNVLGDEINEVLDPKVRRGRG